MIKNTHNLNDRAQEPLPDDCPAAESATPAFFDGSINILIVDDEPKNLTVLETVLDDPGYRLVRAGSADQALLALVEEEFALLILDVRMPGMTGFELAQMIKERKKTARVPIIFLSAYYNEDQHVLEGYGTGAVDYLHKPVNPAILRSKVAVFAELHRRSRESAIANRALLAEVAERRQAEEQLRETVAELEAFSYSITHDLRAPLRAMQNFSKLLQEDYGSKLDETGEDFLRRIATSASRMDQLIQDVLVYSRVLRRDLKLEPVDVEKLLRGMFETYPEFQEPKTEVTIEGELPAVLGNEAALTQCFSNLVNNAVKFVPLNTKPRVRISAERNGIAVRFWIVDNGIGMDPKYSKTIFEMFQRLSTNYEGTGIGLAIVRKAAERMGGAVGVESEPGKGSRFWLDLKLADNNEINL